MAAPSLLLLLFSPSLLPVVAVKGVGERRRRRRKTFWNCHGSGGGGRGREGGGRGFSIRFFVLSLRSFSPPPLSPNPCGSRSKNEQLASNLERRPFLPQVTALWLERARGAGGVGVFFGGCNLEESSFPFFSPFLLHGLIKLL